MKKRTYWLMHGDTRLGALTPYRTDFPWVYCHFVADPIFREIQPLFEEIHRRAIAHENRTLEDWNKAYKRIDALHLYLLNDDGNKAKASILHIHEEIAWFRGLTQWNPLTEG